VFYALNKRFEAGTLDIHFQDWKIILNMANFLRRYTELPFLIDLLRSQEVALLDPSNWDDRNDAFFIQQYKKKVQAKGIYALCLAEASETYHHWRVFSSGSGGVCIEFDKRKLIGHTQEVANLVSGAVTYKRIIELNGCGLDNEALPFLKRHVFCDEKEFRLIVANKSTQETFLRIPIALAAIRRITLSPWLPKDVAVSVKAALKQIDGCADLKISHSTLIENEKWKNFATTDA
jgi:hypothetical protein